MFSEDSKVIDRIYMGTMKVSETQNLPKEIDERVLAQGLDITPEGCTTKITVVPDTIILTNKLFMLLVCSTCGNRINHYLFFSTDLPYTSMQELDNSLHEIPRCKCLDDNDE